jgi:hypothetical protein
MAAPSTRLAAPGNATSATSKPQLISSYGPSREQIAKKAFEIWKSRGCRHGHDVEDWLEAERLLNR